MNNDPASSPIRDTTLPFFPVAIPKLIIMSVCTFGIYELYWFYRHWKSEMIRTNQSLSPFWRAVFAVFFCYPLFKSIRRLSSEHQINTWFSPGSMALIFISLAVTISIPLFGIQFTWEHPYYITMLSVLPLAAVQSEVNNLHQKINPAVDRNARLSGRNIIVILFGGSILIFTLFFSATLNRSLLLAIPAEGRLQAGSEVQGFLKKSKIWLGEDTSQHYTAAWELEGQGGVTLIADLQSSDFNPYLLIASQGLDSVLEDGDSGKGWNARISFVYPDEGICKVIVSSCEPWTTGYFTLRITQR